MSTGPPPVMASASTSSPYRSAATSLIRASVSPMTRRMAASRKPWRPGSPLEASEASASACAQPMRSSRPIRRSYGRVRQRIVAPIDATGILPIALRWWEVDPFGHGRPPRALPSRNNRISQRRGRGVVGCGHE